MSTVVSRGAARAVTAVVAEDEANLLDELCEMLATLWPELEIRARATDGTTALRAWEWHRPDVMFLDVQMPGVSGLEVARRVGAQSRVAFVTAYDEYAIAAFEHGAVDYLLKPFEPERLAVTVARLRAQLDEPRPDLERLVETLAARLAPRREYLRWITASHGSELRLITTDEICYFQARQKYTVVATREREALISRTIKELAGMLDPGVFWQIHRGTIVNLRHIAGVRRNLRGQLCVELRERRERLPVSAPYAHMFRQM